MPTQRKVNPAEHLPPDILPFCPEDVSTNVGLLAFLRFFLLGRGAGELNLQEEFEKAVMGRLDKIDLVWQQTREEIRDLSGQLDTRTQILEQKIEEAERLLWGFVEAQSQGRVRPRQKPSAKGPSTTPDTDRRPKDSAAPWGMGDDPPPKPTPDTDEEELGFPPQAQEEAEPEDEEKNTDPDPETGMAMWIVEDTYEAIDLVMEYDGKEHNKPAARAAAAHFLRHWKSGGYDRRPSGADPERPMWLMMIIAHLRKKRLIPDMPAQEVTHLVGRAQAGDRGKFLSHKESVQRTEEHLQKTGGADAGVPA